MTKRCIFLFLWLFSCNIYAYYDFNDLCGSYNRSEELVHSVTSSAFSSLLTNGGGVVVTLENGVARYISSQYGYDYSYNPLVKIALIAKTLGKKVKACYDEEYIYVMQLE